MFRIFGGKMSKKTFEELREEAREARKEIILDATAKLFKKKSIFKISMRDIAMEAGMSAGNIYFYFEDREAIVRELMLRDEKNIIDIFRSIIKIDPEDAKLLQQKIMVAECVDSRDEYAHHGARPI
jgi:AcrR family transcriptional regulator